MVPCDACACAQSCRQALRADVMRRCRPWAPGAACSAPAGAAVAVMPLLPGGAGAGPMDAPPEGAVPGAAAIEEDGAADCTSAPPPFSDIRSRTPSAHASP